MTQTLTRTASSRPARIRLNRRQALIYADLLGEQRHSLVIERADLKAKGNTNAVSTLNREIEEIERMQEELSRACEERGWDC